MTESAQTRSSGYTSLVGSALERLSRPGTWLNAAQRVEIAGLARGNPASGEISTVMAEAAIGMAHQPASITRQWLDGLQTQGLDPLVMVEIMGVVSRQVAIDTFMFGVGAEQTALPLPHDGEPSQERVEDAKIDNGALPTVGSAFPPNAFSAVPQEQVAMDEIHAGFYMAIPDMGDMGYTRDGLSRAQMELIAARTSLLNECFY